MTGRAAGLLSRLRIDVYLLLIVGMVALASILPARGGYADGLGWATKIAIGIVFFLHGARLSRQAVVGGLLHWRLHLLVLGATFVLFPLLCVGMTLVPGWVAPPELATGLIFLGCLPSTIQSSIGFTAIGRGNVPAAIASASASNLIGIFLTPAMVAVLLHAQGRVSLDSAVGIGLQLLLPFVAGQLLRPWIGETVRRHGKALSYVDRGSILLIVYTAFSGAVVAGAWSLLDAGDIARLILLCSLLLAVVLGATVAAARLCGMSKDDEVAIVFCGSKKSLATGAPMAGALFPAATAGIVLLPVMIFHQIQLMACAAIAQRYARRADVGEISS